MVSTKGLRSSSLSLSTYLILIVLIAVLPLIAFSSYVVKDLLDAKRNANEKYLRRSAEELALSFDQEITATMRTLEALGQTNSLKQKDLKTFQQIAVRALKTQPTWATILLHDTEPKWLMSALRPMDGKLPKPPDISSLVEVIKTGRPVVGHVIKSPQINKIAGDHSFAVRVPIRDETGKIIWVLSAIISTEATQKLLMKFNQVPNEWTRALIDTKGILGARSRQPEKFVGASASESFLKVIAQKSSGFERTISLDKIHVLTAFSHAETSGWYAVVSVPIHVLDAEVQRTLRAILLWAVGIILISMVVTIVFSRWLKKALRRGADGAAQLARGERLMMGPTKVLEIEELRHSLIEASYLLRSRDKAKSDFLANMSHELRTPLGIILGMNELLSKDNIPPEEKAKSWEIVQRNGQQLSRLIDDILDLSKIEANKLEIEKINFSFPDLVSSIVEDFKLKASEKGVQIKLILEVGSPKLINSDPIRVRQIIFNLLGNAVKFTQQGIIEITVYPLNEDRVRLCVKDTGIGLSKAQQEALFEDFTQGDSTHTRKYGGTGLGLSLSRRLARLLEGDVRLIRSAPDLGSEFEAEFKVSPPVENSVIFDPVLNELKTETVHTNKRVLIAEDSADNVTLIKAFLKNEKVQIDFAVNGHEAVKLTNENKYDLIFMDLQMPDMDGYEATQIIRDSGLIIPIVAFTAHALSDHRTRAMQSGFTDFLTKPVRREKLIEVLRRYLN